MPRTCPLIPREDENWPTTSARARKLAGRRRRQPRAKPQPAATVLIVCRRDLDGQININLSGRARARAYNCRQVRLERPQISSRDHLARARSRPPPICAPMTRTSTATTKMAAAAAANESFQSGAFVVQLARTLRRQTRCSWQREADRNTESAAEDRCAKKGRSSVCIAPRPPPPPSCATTIGHRSMRSDLCLSSAPLCELINHPQTFAFWRARSRRGGKAPGAR